MKDIEKRGMSTRIIHAGQHVDPTTGAVATPIYQSSTFAFRDADHGAACFGGEPGYKYTRLGNPTTEALEQNIATLEGGCGGLGAASGMAAVNMVYLTYLGVDTHIVATESLYGPSRMILENEYPRFGVSSSFVDSTNPENVAAAMRDNTKLVYVETPANPTLKMTDIAACAEIAHDRGALLCVDNTFASPYLQNPLQQGADIVLHSMTKFINGHTDVVAGMVVARDPEVYARLRKVHYNAGARWIPIRPGWCCGASRASVCAWIGPRKTPSSWRLSWRSTPRWTGSATPAWRAIPSTSWASARCAAPAPSSASA